MPPSSENFYNTPENNNQTQQYLDIERGDIFGTPPPQQDDNNNQQNQQQQQQNQQQQNQRQKQIDPVEVVKNMISSGFTPTRAQIMNANNSLGGPNDSSNTWFAIFLQRLVKQKNAKNRRK